MNDKKFYKCCCPICGNTTQNSDFTIKDKFGEWININICKYDGLVYLNPRWSKGRYKDFYKYLYDELKRPKVFEGNVEFSYKHPKRIMKRVFNNGFEEFNSIIDVGAGRGWTLDYMKSVDNEIETFAIESSEECRNQMVERGHKILPLDINHPKYSYDKKFDLIIMRHVLEHLYKPNVSLGAVKNLMHDDSILYLAVPNINKIKGSNGFHCAHLYYFSDRTIRMLFNNIGFEILVSGDELKSELWYILKKSDSAYKRQLDKIWRYING